MRIYTADHQKSEKLFHISANRSAVCRVVQAKGGEEMEVERTVRLARAGDRKALSDLCEYFHPQLLRFFLRLTASRADADDLAQATLLKMMEKLETFHFLPGRRFEGWLFRIAYHLFIDGKRRDKYLPLDDDFPIPDPSPGAEELLLREESARAVRSAVMSLDNELQVLISMRYELEMPYRDIAQALNIPVTRVKWRLHDALVRLKAALEKEGGVQL